MAIKVLVVSNYRLYHATRPEAQIFIGLAKAGFRIFIMTYSDSPLIPEFEAAGITVIPFHPEKKFKRSETRRIRETIIRENIDILHLFNSRAIINGIRATRGLPVKTLLYRGYEGHIHWYDPFSYLKYLHPRVDKIVCNTKNVEEQIQRQLFFDKRKTITIHKGHDVEWYNRTGSGDIRKELNLPENTFLLITNARVDRKMKGIKYLLEAMNYLPTHLPVHLLIAGNNPDTKKTQRLLRRVTRRERVHFLGFRADILAVYACCNTFVLPSIYGESLTKSVVEAMSLGLPPVISDVPGNKALVISNESGIVFPAGNAKALSEAILRLYHDPRLCKVLGDNARNRIAEHFNIGQTIAGYRKLYEDLTRTALFSISNSENV
jgi:glycosyltransferase involved in cell wall biosynthesis